MTFFRRVLQLLLCLGVAVLASCTSYREAWIGELRPGDRVRLTTTDGALHEFEVVALEEDALVGPDLRLAFEEIASVEKQTPNHLSTVLLAGGVVTLIVVGTLLLATVLAVDAITV